MNSTERSLLLRVALLFMIAWGASCGSSDNSGDTADLSAADTSAPQRDEANTAPGGRMASPEAASVRDAFKEMAASQGIYLGEVPAGFPLDFLPLYPGGEIDKSNVDADGFTLLQLAPADKDTVFAWYRNFYAGIGWSDSKPITVAGRTLSGFQGKGGKVDMTLIDREEGKTFIALALSPN